MQKRDIVPPETVNLRRVVVIVVDFQDVSVGCPSEDINNYFHQTSHSGKYPFPVTLAVKSIYHSNSFGTIDFAGHFQSLDQWDVFGPFKIPYDLGKNAEDVACKPDLWAEMADDSATQAGVQLKKYQHRVYVVPAETQTSCKWQGLGWIGCGLYCRYYLSSLSIHL